MMDEGRPVLKNGYQCRLVFTGFYRRGTMEELAVPAVEQLERTMLPDYHGEHRGQ
jgi:hypothetical protein